MRKGSTITISDADNRQVILRKLEQVEGIAHKTAEALFEMGIRDYDELIQFLKQNSKQDISKAFQEHGVNYRSGLINKEKMIASAIKNSGNGNSRLVDPLDVEQHAKESPTEAPHSNSSEQAATFTISFDWVTLPDGCKQLRTTVYDEKNFGKEEPFFGDDPTPWLNWLFNRANLPAVQEAMAKPVFETSQSVFEEVETTEPTEIPPMDVSFNIIEVDVSEPPPSLSSTQQKNLKADIQFEITGSQVEKLVEAEIPCYIQVYMVDLDREAIQPIYSDRKKLQADLSRYERQFEFPIPDLGHYELQTVLFLPEPGTRFAFYQGSRFKVSPFLK